MVFVPLIAVLEELGIDDLSLADKMGIHAGQLVGTA